MRGRVWNGGLSEGRDVGFASAGGGACWDGGEREEERGRGRRRGWGGAGEGLSGGLSAGRGEEAGGMAGAVGEDGDRDDHRGI